MAENYKYLTDEDRQMMIQSRIQNAERQLFDATMNRDIEIAAIKAGALDDSTKEAQIKAHESNVAVATARLKAAQALEKKS